MLFSVTLVIIQFLRPINTLWVEPVPMSVPMMVMLVPPDLGPIAGKAGGLFRNGVYISENVCVITINMHKSTKIHHELTTNVKCSAD